MKIRDSRKKWAVLVMHADTHQIFPQQTRYFWTHWGANRFVRKSWGTPGICFKVVRNY